VRSNPASGSTIFFCQLVEKYSFSLNFGATSFNSDSYVSILTKKIELHFGRIFLQTHLVTLLTRVARWFIFKPKIPIWVSFGGPKIVKMLIYFRYGHLEYFTDVWGYCMTIWYILC
jgi:hypothetical protein